MTNGEWRKNDINNEIRLQKYDWNSYIEVTSVDFTIKFFALQMDQKCENENENDNKSRNESVCVLYACKSPLYTYILHMQLFVLSYCLRASFFR